ncbi:hypothetical protein TSUD_154240 [Trifolium subterraneum]|uniref:Disease resistance protein At4g27190-like leucine-rich repeats domain-containing protein n=1 Tax=Trifolium subterraneum TaxID=3900 RepID=A0A2Z6N556_TRISU|nr:hypothetical protein TSUD_154240 [Trifolium subterraneum]
MQTAETFRLGNIERVWRNIIPDIVPLDQGMNDLIEFHLCRDTELQFLIDTKHTDSQVSNVFSKLMILHLEEMENLEELCNGPLPFDFLKSLENLSINYCKNLQSLFKYIPNLCNLKSMILHGCSMVFLFQLSTFRSLVSLERLEIMNFEHLEYIITDERKGGESIEEIVVDDDDDDNDSRSRGAMFPKLVDLRIERCPELESILSFLSAHDLPALEYLQIRNCYNLKYIFGQDVKLGSLKQMELDGLLHFIDIFAKSYGTMTSAIKEPSPISMDISKPQTQLDDIKCNIFSCYGKTPLVSEDQQQDSLTPLVNLSPYVIEPDNIWQRARCLSRQSHILCNIKEIKLYSILNMESVFTLSIARRMLLETLTVEKCGILKHIIIDTGDDSGGNNLDDVFPKLKELYIQNCWYLKSIFGHYNDDHDHPNQIEIHLPALECLHLFYLPRLVAMSPKQYHTTFPSLKDLAFQKRPQVAAKCIGDCISNSVTTRCVDGTTIKELKGNMEHFLTLEKLFSNDSKVESIFCLTEVNEQQMNLGLQKIVLYDQHLMTVLKKKNGGREGGFRRRGKKKEEERFVFSFRVFIFIPPVCDPVRADLSCLINQTALI